MTEIFLRHTGTGKSYKIVKFDREQGMITLQGPHSRFDEEFDKERFKRMGYELVKGGTKDAVES